MRPAQGCEFLGFAFTSGRRATITVAPKKLRAFRRRVRELTGRSRGISMKRRLTELRRYLRGWIGYFGLAQQLDEFSNLDGWIRPPSANVLLEPGVPADSQWRYPRPRIQQQLKLGVSRKLAILHGIRRKKLLADVTQTRHALCHAQQMARRTRTDFAKANLERACSASKNRLVRTRMLGGVGAGVSDGPGYPISASEAATSLGPTNRWERPESQQ